MSRKSGFGMASEWSPIGARMPTSAATVRVNMAADVRIRAPVAEN